MGGHTYLCSEITTSVLTHLELHNQIPQAQKVNNNILQLLSPAVNISGRGATYRGGLKKILAIHNRAMLLVVSYGGVEGGYIHIILSP